MLEDFIKVLKRKNTILLIALIIVSILLGGSIIFAFSEFEIFSETDYDIEYSANVGDGDNTHIIQTNDMSQNKSSTVLVVCITIIVCVLIICILMGVIFYGKSKNANKKEKENNNTQKE